MTPVEEKSMPPFSDSSKEQVMKFNQQKKEEGQRWLNIFLHRCRISGVSFNNELIERM
jgi:hypothetical protein